LPRWSSLAACLLLFAAPAGAAKTKHIYDPELALLALAIQRESVDLVREELLRQADWMGLAGMRVLIRARGELMADEIRRKLTVDTDVLEEYRLAFESFNPGNAADIAKLVAEVRRYHDLQEGAPLSRIAVPAQAGDGPEFFEEEGIGADVAAALRGTPLMDEPVAYAERRFGTTGPFLRRRRWNLDFYLGSFDDLIPMYRNLGYRRFYRLRAPYVSYGKQAYVLSPEPGLRPRLVYSAFHGQDLFLHARAQWGVLTELAKGQGPEVRTLTCPSCVWLPPALRSLRKVIATSPYAADNAVYGFAYLFEPLWKDRRLGVYENDSWRLSYFRTGDQCTVVIAAKHTNYGEIMAGALDEFVRRGAKRVFYGGPAAALEKDYEADKLLVPTQFETYEGHLIKFENALPRPRRAPKSGPFAGLPSPLFATREWLEGARRRKVTAFDVEMARVAEASARWAASPDPVSTGIGAVLGGINILHPDEDRALYTLEFESQRGKEPAKRQFVEAVAKAVMPAGAAE
jgi:hypothetical protein